MFIIVIVLYFLLLLGVSKITARRSNNSVFFRGARQSPWYLVAFGMVGASISGISFVSVPGMVLHSGMAYLYTCLGFIVGYFAVAFILLPIYYNLNLTTIYSLLRPLGNRSYKTGAAFFILSKMTGAAARFYVPCFIISQSLTGMAGEGSHQTQALSFVFPITVVVMVLMIWVYTRRGGIRTLVWTDTLQTLCMFTALCLIIYKVAEALYPQLSAADALHEAFSSIYEQRAVLLGGTWSAHFISFLSGIFIVIVMTGLDQDMMQKNLTCRTLRDAQKDMCTYGFAFIPANLLFLSLGVMLSMLCAASGMSLPENPDQLLTMFAATGNLGNTVLVLFALGIVAAAFSSADSALTALTTCFCVDFLGMKPDDDSGAERMERTRLVVHIGMALVFIVCIMLFHIFNNTSLIDAIYRLCSYTYGPLLGLFSFAILQRKRHTAPQMIAGWAPVIICIASPLVCMALDDIVPMLTGYHFGYELLMINGLITFCALKIVVAIQH